MKALQLKLLLAILAVLTLIGGVLVRQERAAKEPAFVLTEKDRQLQKKLTQPAPKPYLVP